MDARVQPEEKRKCDSCGARLRPGARFCSSCGAIIEEYIHYYNNERIQKKTKWMPPVKFREASMCA